MSIDRLGESTPEARKFAEAAHARQTYGSEPYMVHLEAVAAIVRSVDDSEDAEAVAYLHDVLEDTGATPADLAKNFGAAVSLAVPLVTDPEGYPNRKTRKASHVPERTRNIPESSISTWPVRCVLDGNGNSASPRKAPLGGHLIKPAWNTRPFRYMRSA